MTLSEEAILQQINVLTTKTSENSEMVYKATAALNKGLNPDFFSGNNTKIVNAINKLASEINMLNNAVVNMIEKTNSVLSDVYTAENKQNWEDTKELMGHDNLIDGIKALLEGQLQDKVLNLDPIDVGKILSVSQTKSGDLQVKPITIEEINVEVSSYDVAYLNRDMKGVTSVGEALDRMHDDDINKIVMEDDAMRVISNTEDELASVPLMCDEDLNSLITSLDNEEV